MRSTRINGRKADGIEANSIRLGNQTAYRGRPGQVWGPPIWEFAARKT